MSNPSGTGAAPDPPDRPAVAPPYGAPGYGSQTYQPPPYGSPEYTYQPYAGQQYPGGPYQQPVPPAVPPPAGHRRNTRTFLLVTAVSTVLLAVVIGLIFRLAERAAEDRGAAGAPALQTPQTPLEEPLEEIAPESRSVGVGDRFEIGDYTVAVDEVTLDADDIVAATDPYNEPAVGQYVLVDLTAQYTGDDEGEPYFDLDYTFSGGDARQYASTSCSVVLPIDWLDLPVLEKGGTVEFQVCMDVPPTAVDGGRLFVEAWSVARGEQRVYVTLD